MANATTSVAFHGVAVSNDVTSMVTSPTSHNVIGTFNTSTSIESTIHSLMTKFSTRKKITIEAIFIPGTLVPPWSCLFFEFALRCSANFFKHF